MDEPTWENVFNSSHNLHGFIVIAQGVAESAGYPYFRWNDRVYDTVTGNPTDYIYDSQWKYFREKAE